MKIYLVVVDTLADWEIGYLTAELHSRRFFANPVMDFGFFKAGITAAPVATMGGMQILPDVTLEAIALASGDLLLLPGAEIWDQPQAAPALAFARDALAAGHNVAAICGATIGLASIGALDTLRHTSNDPGFLQQSCPTYRGAALYERAPAVRDRNLVTATGLAPLEFAYEVLKLLGVWREETLEAWFQLHRTREERWFHALVASMGPAG